MSENVIQFQLPQQDAGFSTTSSMSTSAAIAQGFLQPLPTFDEVPEPRTEDFAELIATVSELLSQLAETERELQLAESQRDEAIADNASMKSDLDRLETEQQHLIVAYQEATDELHAAQQDADTLRCALGDLSFALRKSNAQVRRLSRELKEVRVNIGAIAKSAWAFPLRERLRSLIAD